MTQVEGLPSMEELQGRLKKLAERGYHNPLMLVNLRLDLVTQLLTPDSLIDRLESVWHETVARYCDDMESQANRNDLLKGVQ